MIFELPPSRVGCPKSFYDKGPSALDFLARLTRPVFPREVFLRKAREIEFREFVQQPVYEIALHNVSPRLGGRLHI